MTNNLEGISEPNIPEEESVKKRNSWKDRFDAYRRKIEWSNIYHGIPGKKTIRQFYSRIRKWF